MNETIIEEFLNEVGYADTEFSLNGAEEEDDGYTYVLYVEGISYSSLFDRIMNSHYRGRVVRASGEDFCVLRKENIDTLFTWISYYFEDSPVGLKATASIVGIEYLAPSGVIVSLPNKEVYDALVKADLKRNGVGV